MMFPRPNWTVPSPADQSIPLRSRIARRVWRTMLASRSGPAVARALVWTGHRFPYACWPGQGAAVGELTRRMVGPTVVATLSDGVRIVVPVIPEGVGLYIKGAYTEEGTIRLFRRFWKPGQVFFDVGANLGLYTFHGAHGCGPGGQIHAFEPQLALTHCLEQSATLLDANAAAVTIVAAAVSSRHASQGTLFYAADREGTGIPSLLAHEWLDATSGGLVPTVSIDGYRREFGIDRIDAMKVDVEGAEMLVLLGMERTLHEAPPDLMVLEVLPETLSFRHIARGAPLRHAPTAAHPIKVVELLGTYGYEPRHIELDGRLGAPFDAHELQAIAWSTNIGFTLPALATMRPELFAAAGGRRR